jgi:hypothetical protein
VATPGDATRQLGELLSTPLEELLVALGSGIGRSQAELDRNSIAIQQLILADPQLAQYGVEATWYQIPSTQLELKVAVTLTQPLPPTTGEPEPEPQVEILGPPTSLLREEIVPLPQRLPRMWIAPVTPTYQNLFGFNVGAASTVTLSIVAVPPPGPAAAGAPRMTADEVRQTADEYLVKDGEQVRGRLTVNYSPGAGAWFVIQTDETKTPPHLLAFVKIDDATGRVLETRTGT